MSATPRVPEDQSDPRGDRPLSFPLLAICFFGSGLTALIYELLWTRRLNLTFGSTTYSVTTVLAAFMAGLGLGSYIIGRRVDRSRLGGIRIYALLELGVGLYALLSLPLLTGVEKIYAALQSWLQLSQEPAAVLKLLLAFPVLALPAGLMGGTLPALVRGLLRSRAGLHTTVSRLYGINTAGAAVGTALAGMLMVEFLGLWRSMALSALINLSIAVVVLTRLGRAAPPSDTPPPDDDQGVRLRDHLRRMPVLFCVVAVALTGLLSMLYEIVWTRILSLVLGSSTYAFTLVLAVFLVGLALGALIYGRASRNRPPAAFGLTLVLLALALWVVFSLVVIPFIPQVLVSLAQVPVVTFHRVLLFETLFALFVLLPPTLLLGAALPMAMGIIGRSAGHTGRDVGGVYLVNTLGAIVGSVLTGFLLVPLLGTQRCLLGGLLANLLLVGFGVLAFGAANRLRVLGFTVVLLTATVALVQPPWPEVVFDSGLGYRLELTVARTRYALHKRLHRTPNKLLHREEGRNATITVRNFARGVALLVNGKPDASTSGDMLTQVVLGVVATMAHPDPQDVGVVGWGSGVTTYTISLFPRVRQVDTIEIEPAVLHASRFFHGVNGKAEQLPKVRVIFDDARSYFLTTDRRYDVVVSEPSNPWMSGVSGLFSSDYFRMAKRKLKPGGVFGQWLQLYRIDSRNVALILRTVLRSFAHVQVWASDPNNVILLGSDRPIHIDLRHVQRTYHDSPVLQRHMSVFGPGPLPEQFYGCFLLDRAALERIIRRFPDEIITDDLPVLEYRAVRNLYAKAHPHMQALWAAKTAMNQVLPPDTRTSPALAMAGAAALYRAEGPLSDRITAWAMQRFGGEPLVRLARAKALFRVGRPADAARLARTLPAQPELQAEVALLEGRIALKQHRPQEALKHLERMGRYRPTARLIYLLKAAIAAGQWDTAFGHAEQLVGRLDETLDLDVLRLSHGALYAQIESLTDRSGLYARAIRLLNSRREPRDGEVNRLWALAKAYWSTRDAKAAARAMDQLMQFNMASDHILRLCGRVYRAVHQPQKARPCEQLHHQLFPTPAGEPLWSDRGDR